ncbi:long-chain fatty acid--CoA ligase [Actinomadura madurae]|nr:AMP-binding protein [Actinomadura madurae]MCQ0013116.1 long-chain fatty acid--CoA ligase [Actinomadura madurae]
MRNYPEWSVAFFGAAAAGAVVVPLNAWWSAGELEYGLADSGAKVLIADAERAERLAGVLPKLGVPCLVARPDGPPPDGAEAFEDALGDTGDPAAASLPQVALDPEDEATIFYTSGTTGRPRAPSARTATSPPTPSASPTGSSRPGSAPAGRSRSWPRRSRG